MKNFLVLLLALPILITSCEPRSKKAAEYNDRIIEHQIEISNAFDALDTTFNEYVAEEMDYAHLMLRSKIETGQRVLDTLGGFKEDETLLNAARKLFTFYDNISSNEYKQMIDIMKIPDSLYTQQDQERASQVEDAIIEQFKTAQEEFTRKQEQFGGEYNVVFEE